jgi:thioredoxin 1
VQQDVDVASADPERGGDVLPWLFFEHAQHHHGLLRFAELIDARTETDVLLGLGDERFGRCVARRDERKRVEVLVRNRNVMTAALVARRVADDAAQVGRPLGALRRELLLLRELEERAERVLDAFDRILGRCPFPASHANELAATAAGEVAHDAKDVRFGRAIHEHFSYSDSRAVRTVAVGTFFRVGGPFRRPPHERIDDMGASKNVLEVTDDNFDTEVLKADKPVLVDFGATWCGPCKALAPVVDKLADETVGKYKIVKVDIDDAPEVAKKYGIKGVPALLVFKNGEKTAQHIGVTTRDKIVALIEG